MRTLRLVTLVTLGTLLMVGSARASEKAKTGIPSPSKSNAPQSPPAAPTHDVKKPEGSKAGPAPVAATTVSAQPPREETLEEIVARVRRRLAQETSPVKRTSAAPAPAKPSDRVTLVWRPYVVWPDELTSAPSEPARTPSERVTLEWNRGEQ